MKDHLAINVSHPFLMTNNDVIHQVIYFIKNGVFEKNDEIPVEQVTLPLEILGE